MGSFLFFFIFRQRRTKIMIKLEHVVTPSHEQIMFVIEGMRNPMNSWANSDSTIKHDEFILGENDYSLMKRLAAAGTDHRKFMRMMPVYVRITAPLYWWKEFDTYKIGTVANSCSTMYKIMDKKFVIDDFSHEHLNSELDYLWLDVINLCRDRYLETKDKIYWYSLITLLPSSYNQTRNVMLNYEVLTNIYHSRKNHKLDEWHDFCTWIESLPYSELIIDTYVKK